MIISLRHCVLLHFILGMAVFPSVSHAEIIRYTPANNDQKQVFIDGLTSELRTALTPVISDAYIYIELDARMVEHWRVSANTQTTQPASYSDSRLVGIERELSYLNKALPDVSDERFKIALIEKISVLNEEKTSLNQLLAWQANHIKTQEQLEILSKRITITLNEAIDAEQLKALEARLTNVAKLNKGSGDKLELIQRYLPLGDLQNDTETASFDSEFSPVTSISQSDSASNADSSLKPSRVMIGIPVIEMKFIIMIIVLVLLGAIGFIIYGARKNQANVFFYSTEDAPLVPELDAPAVAKNDKPISSESSPQKSVELQADKQAAIKTVSNAGMNVLFFQALLDLTDEALRQIIEKEPLFVQATVLRHGSAELSSRLIKNMEPVKLLTVIDLALRLPPQSESELNNVATGLQQRLDNWGYLSANVHKADDILQGLLMLDKAQRADVLKTIQSHSNTLNDRLFDLLNFYAKWVDSPSHQLKVFTECLTLEEQYYLLSRLPDSSKQHFSVVAKQEKIKMRSDINLTDLYDKLYALSPPIEADQRNEKLSDAKAQADELITSTFEVSFTDNHIAKETIDFLDFSHLKPNFSTKK